MLASVHWTRSDVTPMDSRYEVLGFYRGDRMVANVTVGFNRKPVILSSTDLASQKYAFGSNIANDARVLSMLAVVFVLMTAVWPLWRMRNLDVLVVTSLSLSVVLFNRGELATMVLVTYPALIYLALRSAWWGLGNRRGGSPATPLYSHLTRRWSEPERLRTLRLGAVAVALIVVMVGLTSLHVLDVGYAVMEGATGILHGVIPYGHIPDILHGDTYPLGSYLLYVPFAWATPVHNVWDNADLTLVVALAAALLLATGLWRMVLRRERSELQSSSVVPRSDGLRAAIAALTFPPLLVTVSTGTTDVVLAAMLVAVMLLWYRPGWCMAVLSGAAWFKLAPLAIMPLLLARWRGRALARAGAALIFTSGLLVVVLVALGGSAAVGRMLSAIRFQFTRASPHTLWAVVGSVPLQQLAQAATLALIAGAVVKLRREGTLADDRRRLAAIGVAVLLGIQISANYWSFLYLVWITPLLLLSILSDDGNPIGGSGAPRDVRVQISSHRVQPEQEASTLCPSQPM